MSSLVEAKGNEVFTDSSLVARKVGISHRDLCRIIDNVLNDYPDLREVSNHPKMEKYFTEERTYRGQSYTAFIMNRSFFSLVVMRLTTKKARKMQRLFNAAFYEMEEQLIKIKFNQSNPELKIQRNQSKALRKDTTDVIQLFVEYAINQGSESANFYYKHFTKATYKALGLMQHKQPKLRDTLDSLQLAWLVSAESVASSSIKKYMREGINYKEIFVLVRNDIEAFAKSLYLLNELGGKS